jgi:predicted nucleic acid-binding protein
MTAELAEKLRHSFGFSENQIQAALYDIRSISERVSITGDVHVVTDDPDDDKFIECRLVARARAIASGDHHVLEQATMKESPYSPQPSSSPVWPENTSAEHLPSQGQIPTPRL